jgi:hypothetical protein
MRRRMAALAAVRLLPGLHAQEAALPRDPGHAGAVQPAAAARGREVGAQLGRQVPGRLHVRRRRARHR